MDLLELHLEVMQWIDEAKAIIQAGLKSDLIIEEKTGYKDLVTNVDKQVEQYFVANIRELYPTHKIMGEEGSGDKIHSLDGFVWIIDPIDGTLNFVTKQRDYGIMIALYKDGVGQLGYIYDVSRDQLMYGIRDYGAYCDHKRLVKPFVSDLSEGFLDMNCYILMDANERFKNTIRHSKGTRAIGASSIEHMNVFLGNSLAYLSEQLAPWDVACGMVIARELGYFYRTLDNKKIDLLSNKTSLLVCHPAVALELLNTYN
ncbi:myo-inositol-1(or 4)-monophosphatase [Granulicatella balaenopterae]|uniref:Myo-inositol-1(Or 4)-monophosphatase n=1 Tax=Granulicatella balaenopterae TaxID=137733 RepID=A0A1H9JZC1_9LACT|nr:inositol monophosphatase family protein [Granulicatella balaenopterae]SEQ92053.1 myo-inositol-1(or 4)-monophosphatase [Granulicatella balaenopterae]